MEQLILHSRRGAPRSPRSGFTLFEVMVAMGITMGIMVAALSLYVNALKGAAVNQSQISANSSARLAMDYIDKDIKQAIIIPCYTGAAGCTSGTSVAITNPSTAAGTYTPDGNTLVLQMPAWNSATSATITGIYDTVIYQYVRIQTGGGTHNCYNIRRIVSPGAGSSRTAEDRWLLPYNAQRDAVNTSLRRSDPSVDYVSGATQIFWYHVQTKDGSGNATGQTQVRVSEAWKDVVLVETKFNVTKTHDASTITADASTRSRLRNWTP